jgi:hypothetical protein
MSHKNEAELAAVILDLQMLNRELQHDIKQLMIEMNMMKTELADINQNRFLQVSTARICK